MTVLLMEAPFRQFVENMDKASAILSQEGVILYANPYFHKMLTYADQELIGKTILSLIPQEQQDSFIDFLKQKEHTKAEFNLTQKDQVHCTVSLSFVHVVYQEQRGYFLLIEDLSLYKRNLNRIECAKAIIQILGEASTLQDAMKNALFVLKNYLQWDLLIVWRWDSKENHLNCLKMVSVPDLKLDEMDRFSTSIALHEGMLPDQAFSNNRPVWKEDLTKEEINWRTAIAIKNHLRGTLSLPFYYKNEVIGVIELFSRTPFINYGDHFLLDISSTLGTQFGTFFARIESEDSMMMFGKVMQYAVDALYSVDKNGDIILWNDSAERVYGWKDSEVIGRNVKILYPRDYWNHLEQLIDMASDGKLNERIEVPALKKNGQIIWVEKAVNPLKNSLGEISGFIVASHDVTKVRKEIDSLKGSEERFRTFVETTEEWIWELDEKYNFTYSNDAVYTILGYTAEEVIGRNLIYFVGIDERPKLEQMLLDERLKKGWMHETMRFLHQNGSDCWIESNASPLLSQEREPIGLRGASRDITETKNLEKIKSEFISTISHELRTPLTSIHASLGLLIHKPLTEKISKELLATAQRNSDRLLKLINDLLDIEKLEYGLFQYSFEKINLTDVVKEAIHESTVNAQKLDLKLVTTNLCDHADVKGDSFRLGQVMINLLSNAIKFSPVHGVIEVAVESLDGLIKVSVSDQGPGVHESLYPKLFQMFFQGETGSNRTHQGTGLGLSISKKIIEGHGGKIYLDSSHTPGSKFCFELPKYSQNPSGIHERSTH